MRYYCREFIREGSKIIHECNGYPEILKNAKKIYFQYFFNNIYMVTTLLIARLTFTWRENNVREQRQNTMLEHLQLRKPKNVLQI